MTSTFEMWNKILDQEEYIFSVFMNLSKTFETLNHDLFIAKIGLFEFEIDALKYMESYLMNKKQRVRVNKYFSEW